jgi:Epoxide hydrolase N terminus
LHVTDAALDLLRRKLEDTRLPEAETVEDWSQGVPLAELTNALNADGPTVIVVPTKPQPAHLG